MSHRLAIALAALLLVGAPVVVRAQDEETPADPAAERQAQYSFAFSEGLQALSRKDLPRSEALFKACIQLFPDQPVAYYNLACTYSRAKKPAEAVQALKDSFQRGFVDLAHMQRDPDLDPIRQTPELRACLAEFETKLLEPVGPALTSVPTAAPPGVLVWVHDQGADPTKDLQRLRAALPDWAIVVPQGLPARNGGRGWDDRAEFVVVTRLRAFLSDLASRQPAGEPPLRAVIAGEGNAGVLAVNIAVHSPDLIAGVLAAGPRLGAGTDDDMTGGQRAYLVVDKGSDEQVESAVEARERFIAVKDPVILEQAEGSALPDDLLRRGVAWLLGQEVRLPGAGVAQTF
jgi:predicted esterase